MHLSFILQFNVMLLTFVMNAVKLPIGIQHAVQYISIEHLLSKTCVRECKRDTMIFRFFTPFTLTLVHSLSLWKMTILLLNELRLRLFSKSIVENHAPCCVSNCLCRIASAPIKYQILLSQFSIVQRKMF